MEAFYGELGKKFAEKWLSLVVLPGLLFVGFCTLALVLGQSQWAEFGRLLAWANGLVTSQAGRQSAALLLSAAAILLAAAGAGVAAQALGGFIQQLWLGSWLPAPLTRWLVTKRLRRWQHAQDRYAVALRDDQLSGVPDLDRRDRLAAETARVSLARPSRATWIGDRMAAVDRRVHAEYGLDLVSGWPRLWLIVPDATRTELRSARGRFDAAATLSGWGTLYLLLGLRWWPAAIGGLVTWVVGWRRAREGIAVFAELVESTVDIHGRDLASALGISCPEDQLTREAGEAITRQVRKGA